MVIQTEIQLLLIMCTLAPPCANRCCFLKPALQALFTISTKQNKYQYFPYTFVLPQQIPLALLCHDRIQQDKQHLHLE